MSPCARGSLVARLARLAIALACHAWRTVLRRPRPGAVVLCLHGVRADQAARLERQLARLRGRAIDLAEVPTYAARTTAPPRVALTFDDAFANLVPHLLPAARRHAVPVAIFAVSGNLGTAPRWSMPADHPERDEPTMGADALRDAALLPGVRIGAHGVAHRPFSTLSPEEMAQELRESRAALARIVGRPIDDFAFPHGDAPPAALAGARDAGYARMLTLDPAAESPADGVIGRHGIAPDAWAIEFELTIAGAYEWVAQIRRVLRRRRAARAAAVASRAATPPTAGTTVGVGPPRVRKAA